MRKMPVCFGPTVAILLKWLSATTERHRFPPALT
ncbi:MAG: hypothetical protein SLRJCFUN_001123, partial [Candidatus Fervidibacter sp.]